MFWVAHGLPFVDTPWLGVGATRDADSVHFDQACIAWFTAIGAGRCVKVSAHDARTVHWDQAFVTGVPGAHRLIQVATRGTGLVHWDQSRRAWLVYT